MRAAVAAAREGSRKCSSRSLSTVSSSSSSGGSGVFLLLARRGDGRGGGGLRRNRGETRRRTCGSSISSRGGGMLLRGAITAGSDAQRRQQQRLRGAPTPCFFHASPRLTLASKKDFYDVLGISKGASKADVKKKYFELAKKYHPDTNKDDPTASKKFMEITEAYEVLGDDKKRQTYDTYGHAAFSQDGGGGGGGNPFAGGGPFGGAGGQGFEFRWGGPGGAGGGATQVDPEELFRHFEDFFNPFAGAGGGRGGGRARTAAGADLRTGLRLSFMEAVHGVSKDVVVTYLVLGPDGRPTRKTKTVTVDVPAGVETGVNIRMAGQGGEGAKGAPAGNLYLSIEVEEDPYFKRDGEDIHVEVPVNVAQAMLGATIDVLTLDGMVELKVSQGIQHDTMLLMRGRGVRELQGSRRGNQIVHIKIEVPKSLTAKQKELIQAFQEEEEAKMKKKEGGGGGGGRGGGFFAGGFQERVRDAYTRIKEFMGKKEKDRKGGKEEGKEGGKEGGKEKKTSTAGS